MWQDRLKHYREQKKLTQEALARRMNISVWTLNRWENGRTQPSKMAQEKLAKVGIREEAP